MAKAIALDWREFMAGNIAPKGRKADVGIVIKTAASTFVMMMPRITMAATGNDATFASFLKDVLEAFDWIVLGVIIFAGATWMFGNRTKAIELLIGGSIGYEIIRHAVEIRDWLKSL